MAGDLSKSQQPFENHEFGSARVEAIDSAKQVCSDTVAKRLVVRALRIGHVAMKCLLNALWKFLRDFALRSSKKEWSYGASYDGEVVRLSAASKAFKVPGQAGVEKLHETPQLAEMIFDRRAGHHETVLRPKALRGLCGASGLTLDRLGLVKDHISKLSLCQFSDVAKERSVGDDRYIAR